mmetsp:Transcript_128768/g.191929  ORF Transcript_128768/g.191929 Transcript_128768/m.191929 type:complete len:378 (-) Transcript_128768:339-1472(-)|eukprot:CAMPEP_0117011310 /NCGR_PEP_ID=MMETSP0472-20121206/9752_1 /TAXON_ID=693140 ORGANISM="Tiarina fusus, Strain LIS" /NCGR_SAMPLE_ID=MMETSP0472 /ASSEMBLY_ACC=CAM_ASM_000603 /LENGTH=377 /DNA_ID=CAMNT_0004714075 /DNA_START=140 /DNA_END=1273 /DNA_ORIENTATION=-
MKPKQATKHPSRSHDIKPQHRRKMTQQIIRILKQELNWSSFDGFSKVLQMAKRLESCLYNQAASFESYQDKSTLMDRINRALAGGSDPKMQNDSHQENEVQAPMSTATLSTTEGAGISHLAGNSGGCSCTPIGRRPCHASVPRLNSRLSDIGSAITLPNCHSSLRGSKADETRAAVGQSCASMPETTRTGAATTGSRQNGIEGSATRAARIRRQQERLLSLHHAAKCRQVAGRCTISLDCADMKSLWKHLERCRDKNCTVPFCFSSREILSHHLKCEDQTCPVCVQVRATVERSRNRPPQESNQHRPEIVAIGWNAAHSSRDDGTRSESIEAVAAFECHGPLVCAVPAGEDEPLGVELPVIVLSNTDMVETALPLMG